jgi:uncharacterized protein (TIGR03032 family)
MAYLNDELWAVNTLFSCLCSFDGRHSFVPRWQPKFISTLAAEDRCHLNGMAVDGEQVRYVTVMAESDTPGGWRPTKVTSGCVINIANNEVISRGFAMPHSPRLHEDQLWLLDSGHGRLTKIDRTTGQAEPVCVLPGYTRGLAIHDQYAFVGLSKIRETSTFGGMPIAASREQLKCGVGAIHLPSGRLVAHFEFITGVEEIFDVQVIPQSRCLWLQGPHPQQDDAPPIWVVPQPKQKSDS